MARNIRWFINFKSLNGVSCTVNIYDNDWPSGVTLGLTGASDPFYFEEDDSSDLLNNVLRYRTGYIRVIEQAPYGSLDDIYPTGTFDRYVEVLYGGTLIFNGYIQVQDFSSELIPTPRILQFPVISPLGLFDKRTFSNVMYLPPTVVTIGTLLNDALGGIYDYVFLPKNYGSVQVTFSFSMSVSTLVVCPWNDDYHHSQRDGAYYNVMRGRSFAFLIDAICKAFGWICHDTPEGLLFTAFDYEGDYCSFPVGHIGDFNYLVNLSISSLPYDLTDYFTPCDANANVQTLLPDTGIEISYEGEPNTREITLKRTYVPDVNGVVTMPSFVPSYPNYAEEFSICNLVPVLDNDEFSSNLLPLTFDSSDKINVGQCCCAWNGEEGIMASIGSSYQSGRELFWVRCYVRDRPNISFAFSYDMKGAKNGALGALAQYESDVDEFYITTDIDATHDDYVQISFKYRFDSGDHPQLPNQALIFITNMTLHVYEDNEPYAEYRYAPTGDSDIIPSTGNPAISSSLTMPMSPYRLNSNLIGDDVLDTKITTYPYLFKPRKELTSKFTVIDIPDYAHACLYSYLGKRWRIIAQKVRPWDDIFALTMQSVTNDGPSPVPPTPGRLPAGYTELAYIQGTGTQYINTNVMCSSNNVEVLCKCTYEGTTTTEKNIISNQDGSTGRFGVGTYGGNIFMYSRDASGSESTGNVTIAIPSGEFDIKAIYDKTGSKRTLYVNGVSSEKSYTRTIANNNRTILVFAGYYTSGAKQYFYLGKIYYIKYKEDGVLIFDYVPAIRDSDSVVGMYDLVSNTFLTNAGSGTFSYGTLE